MLNVASLVPEEKSTVLYLALGDLPVVYRPKLMLAIQEEEEPDEDDDEQVRSRLARDLCRVLVSWEMGGKVPIMDTPGHPAGSVYSNGTDPIPLDPDILKYLPSPLLQELSIALALDASPDAEAMGKRLRKRGRSTRTSTRSS